jgi:hypothetical protein
MADHDIQGTALPRPPGSVRNSKPMSWLKPLVRFETTEPSLAETRTMSYSRSRWLPVTMASRSPDGDGSTVSALVRCDFSGSGARLRP